MLLMLIALGVIVGGGAVALVRLTRQPEGVRRLLEAPRLAISAAPDAADVRLEGTVELLDGATVEGPLSGTRCVYYDYTATEIADVGAMGGAATSAGRILRHDTGGAPFILRDASGYAIVDPHGATALLEIDHQADDQGGSVGRVLMRVSVLPSIGGRTGTAERERLIVAGDRIVVIGRGVREPDPDPASAHGLYRDGSATRLLVSTSPELPLHLLDLAHAGTK